MHFHASEKEKIMWISNIPQLSGLDNPSGSYLAMTLTWGKPTVEESVTCTTKAKGHMVTHSLQK
jgi:hypothetical protein